MPRHSPFLYALLWHHVLLGSRQSAQVHCLHIRPTPQVEQSLHARRPPSDLSAIQEGDYELKIPQKTFTQSMLLMKQSPVRNSTTNGICMVMPISSVNRRTHMEGNETYGALARSVLDTWGAVHAPDSFNIVFPSSQDLADFQKGYGGISDPRLLVLDASMMVSTARREPTFPQNPSPLRLFEAIRKRIFGMKFNDSNCKWYMSVDGDSYVNPDALMTQLANLDHTSPYYLGTFVYDLGGWNRSLYGAWAHGSTGHLVSRALLESVDWGACVQELQDRRDVQREGGPEVIGHDDVETGACIWRHLPKAKRVVLEGVMLDPSFKWQESKEVRSLVDRMDPRWMEVAVAHRMSVKLNYDSAKLSKQLFFSELFEENRTL